MTGQEHTPFKIHTDAQEVLRESFDRRLPRIEYRQVPFDLQRVALALFSSTYRSPISLLLPKEQADVPVVSDVAVTVELAQAVYAVDEHDEPRAAAYELPEWYLRGMAHFTDGDGIVRTAPIHVFLTIREDKTIESAEAQFLCAQDLILDLTSPND